MVFLNKMIVSILLWNISMEVHSSNIKINIEIYPLKKHLIILGILLKLLHNFIKEILFIEISSQKILY